MEVKKEWTIVVRRDGRFWFIEIPEVGATQARTLSEVGEMARDYIAGMTDTPEDSISLSTTIELPADVQAHLTAARELRVLEADARSRAAEESRAAARALKDLGLTIREVGTALGISHQRAQQLVETKAS